MRQQLLIERAPIGADAHRLVVADRGFDDGAELLVLLFLEADIAGIDAIFVERLGAGRMVGEKLVADVVKVADDRHVDFHLEKPFLDVRHGGRGLVAVDGDAHDLRAGARQRRHLRRRRLDIGGVGIGHRLHHNGRAAADGHVADLHGNGLMPCGGTGKFHHEQGPYGSQEPDMSRADASAKCEKGPAAPDIASPSAVDEEARTQISMRLNASGRSTTAKCRIWGLFIPELRL